MFRLRSKQNVQLVVNSPIGLAKKYFKIIIIVTGVKLNGHSHKYCGNINGYFKKIFSNTYRVLKMLIYFHSVITFAFYSNKILIDDQKDLHIRMLTTVLL